MLELISLNTHFYIPLNTSSPLPLLDLGEQASQQASGQTASHSPFGTLYKAGVSTAQSSNGSQSLYLGLTSSTCAYSLLQSRAGYNDNTHGFHATSSVMSSPSSFVSRVIWAAQHPQNTFTHGRYFPLLMSMQILRKMQISCKFTIDFTPTTLKNGKSVIKIVNRNRHGCRF